MILSKTVKTRQTLTQKLDRNTKCGYPQRYKIYSSQNSPSIFRGNSGFVIKSSHFSPFFNSPTYFLKTFVACSISSGQFSLSAKTNAHWSEKGHFAAILLLGMF